MPLVGACWLSVSVAVFFGKKGGLWRLLGVLSSLAIGGVVIGFTHLSFSGEDGSTVLWWIGIIAGGLVTLLGLWSAVMQETQNVQD
jgi:hypothetical protein